MGLCLAGVVHDITPAALNELRSAATQPWVWAWIQENKANPLPAFFRTLNGLGVKIRDCERIITPRDYGQIYKATAQLTVLIHSESGLGKEVTEAWLNAEEWHRQLLELYENLSGGEEIESLVLGFIAQNVSPEIVFSGMLKKDEQVVQADKA